LSIYFWAGNFVGPFSRFLLPVTVIAIAATVIESLPHKDIDNFTVTLLAAVMGYFLF